MRQICIIPTSWYDTQERKASGTARHEDPTARRGLTDHPHEGLWASTVDDICHAAGVSKGSFFHHFTSKEAALAAAEHFSTKADALFAAASYRNADDARERVLGYVALRSELLRGELPDFTCLLGTMVQETCRFERCLSVM